MARELALDALLGRTVRDASGRGVGRIEEVHAEVRDGACEVREYELGVYGVIERLAAWRIGRWLLDLAGGRTAGYLVPWNKLDLTDPGAPRLRGRVTDLERAPTRRLA
jgi:hypothetical protein